MPKNEATTLQQDFRCQSEAELNAQIAAFAATHEATHHQILAMDGRRSLGPGKVRVTFRVIAKKPAKRAKS